MLEQSVINSVKTADPDRYRAAMLAEPETRQALLTLYAFHYELAKVPELVSEPMMGAIRYQWWRDAIEEIYVSGQVRRHEVSTPLAEVLQRYDVPRFWVDNLIDGRERDLDPTPFADMATTEKYVAATSGTLARIAALICAPEDAEAAAGFGQAWGMTGLLRGWQFYADSMLKGISRDALIQATRQSYGAAKSRSAKVSPALMPAIAYAALIPGFQKRHAVTPPKSYSALAKQSRLLMTAMTGKLP